MKVIVIFELKDGSIISNCIEDLSVENENLIKNSQLLPNKYLDYYESFIKFENKAITDIKRIYVVFNDDFEHKYYCDKSLDEFKL